MLHHRHHRKVLALFAGIILGGCFILGISGCLALRTPLPQTRQEAATLVAQGQQLAAQDNHAGAIASYDRALKLLPRAADALYARGLSRLALGDTAGAEADFTSVITQTSASAGNTVSLLTASADVPTASLLAHACVSRGMTRVASGRLDEALADFTSAIRTDAQITEAWAERGQVYLARGKMDEALADFDQAVILSPKLAAAHLGRGRVLQARKDWQGALEAWSRAIAADPLQADAFRGRITALLELKRFGDAARDIDSALVLAPDDADLWLARGRIWRATGFPANALGDINRAIELSVSAGSPPPAAALIEQALAKEETGDITGALDTLAAARQAAPDRNMAWLQTARILGKQQRIAEIPPLLTPFIDAHPQDADVIATRGSAELDLGQLEPAMRDFHAALAINPDLHWARYLLSFGWLKQHRTGEALAVAEDLIQRAPDLALGYQARASVEKERKDLNAAVADFGRAIERNPDAPFPRIERAYILLARGAAAEALADLDVAVRTSTDPVVQLNRADALHRLGRLEEAIAACRQAVQLNPALPDAHKDLGLVLLENDQLDEAAAAFVRAGELAPGNGDAVNLRGIVCLIRGDYAGAIARFQDAIELYGGAQSYAHLSLHLAHRLTGLSDPGFAGQIAAWQNPWLKQLGQLLLGRVTEEEVLKTVVDGRLGGNDLPPAPRERYLSEARFYLGMAQLLQNRPDRARGQLEQAAKSTEFRLYSRATAAAWLRHGLPSETVPIP
ncbi:tetratricopeptide repeat protein [Opitutaceae bacterium TAV4]|nr:tetratricopeptide repeat protein [Opitutaceae bacterium TAV4]RRK00066.1 tetratricopeptide repeat protein [Opitutaceae bacterium TAV3]